MKLTILGSTGSIGTQALDVVSRGGISLRALTGGKNSVLADQQVRKFRPEAVAMSDEAAARDLKIRLGDVAVKVESGSEAVEQYAGEPDSDTVLNAVVGIAGLKPTLAAARAGKRIALANKESRVTGGEAVTSSARENGAVILPVDSEHSAIFQCLQGANGQPVKKIFLTASGGPFLGKSRAELENVTLADTLNHPVWSMGAKITVDSATLFNKGFELIEAAWLFGVEPRQIQIVVHPQSVLHSAVMFNDNSIIGQMGIPDMRLPIQYALNYPLRGEAIVPEADLASIANLTFCSPDYDTFNAPLICRDAVTRGGTAPAVVNGANEAAVELFLKGKISFLQITEAVSNAVDAVGLTAASEVGEILAADRAAREYVVAEYGGSRR